ncbi:hypothetical protein K1T71_006667 [Dendrolimus kikuchii]|uniref:Uncharacterized protein n=1 Tax=Dendrolimus kikuchii TaxID=765133 RepID=A0ACC1D1E8_9NEOP|nr:hypothetical protein K1T71_006667 [Dendrolimus kikuchii]
MIFTKRNRSPILVIFLVIFASSFASDESGGKTLNLKIGFDLTEGSNGSPSLRIRDFEDSSEYKPRAFEKESTDDEDKKSTPSVRADSSESGDDAKDKEKRDDDSSIGIGSDKSDDDDDNDSNESSRRITKGLKAGDYEPEDRDSPNVHESYKGHSDAEEGMKRRKREAGIYEFLKRKGKKVRRFIKRS